MGSDPTGEVREQEAEDPTGERPVTPASHPRWLALLLTLVTGWGHVYLGLERRGLLLFTLEALSLFVVVNVALSYQGSHSLLYGRAALTIATFFWLWAFIDVWRLTSPGRLRRIEREKATLLRAGMISYLRGDLPAAEGSLREALRLDGHEVEALLRLGIVLARGGQLPPARRFLKRARREDLAGKWQWEIARELAALREHSGTPETKVTAPPRSSGTQGTDAVGAPVEETHRSGG